MPAATEGQVSVEESLYRDNLRLAEMEFQQQHLHLRSFPRFLGLVLGNSCNIDCPHCYQAKNGDNLLKPSDIGEELRREFQAFYPYLSTLRVQGGEAFAFSGFADLIEDVRASVRRPILSVSTNGTLIDERWAERIVRTPFRNLTVSIDGGTPATYARLRRGADLEEVLANVARIRRWKQKLASEMPFLDSFFVVMRSNFRELPEYFQLMAANGFSEISLQTPEINRENSSREPTLAGDEVISDSAEARELHHIMQGLLPVERLRFAAIRTSGFTSLFNQHGLDAAFLREGSDGLYPDRGALIRLSTSRNCIPLCPNPWTTLFVSENGDVHLCFLAEPIGNLYQAPVIAAWNSPAALAKRRRMTAGRYVASGCSPRWCGWREGSKAAVPPSAEIQAGVVEMRQLTERAGAILPVAGTDESTSGIAAVRRLLAARERDLCELQALFAQLCETNRDIHERGQRYIAQLEANEAEMSAHIARLDAREAEASTHIAHLEAKAAKVIADLEALDDEMRRLRWWRIIRLAVSVARLGRSIAGYLRRGGQRAALKDHPPSPKPTAP